ncbi:hypothetical protein [Brachybacterium massiliense]|uniref:hypothetical protein n=1 Tax=Brachybacterium massiliense TaxID=1755098 RepID=UPI000B3BC58F|nr:hypothetical protein [Brachybacterium massiliense]
MSTTSKTTTPALLTEATEAEVSEALLRHATRNYPGAALVEHQGVVPPVGPEHVTYRLGALEVEELGWSAGGAKVSQRIDVWAPEMVERGASTSTTGAAHADLGKIEQRVRQASLSDGTTVLSGVYSVEVFPFVPLIEGREEQAARVALGDRHRGRKVTEVGPVEGTPEHRHQVVELSLSTGGDVRGALQELRGMSTAAGYVAEVGELDRWADAIGDSVAAATPSRERVVILAGVLLEWREA